MPDKNDLIAKVKDLNNVIKTEMEAAGTLLALEEITEEQLGSVQKHHKAADEAKALLSVYEMQLEGEKYLDSSKGTTAAHLGWRNSSPGEGEEEIDEKAWRSFTIKTRAVHPEVGVVTIDKEVRYNVPLRVTKALKNGYADVWEGYIREGKEALTHNDLKTLQEGLDSAGGYLVVPDYQESLIRKIATMATMRANARVIQVSSNMATWPKVHYTTDDKYTSPMRMTWTGETPATASTHRVTDPVFGVHNIPIHTGMASIPLTRDLIEDGSFDVMGVSGDMMAEAFLLGENDAFWNGNGVSRPMGLLTNVDGDGAASVASGTAATLTADGLINVWGALPSQYEPGSKWYMAKSTELVIRKLKDSDNNYLWPVWPQGGNFAAAPRELLGFPTVRDEFLPAIAAGAYPIVFGDLKGYLIADRVGLSIQRIEETYAELNVTVLLGRKRVGGQTIEPWRLKVQKVSA
jgi:HK97 family phage major capsid protein